MSERHILFVALFRRHRVWVVQLCGVGLDSSVRGTLTSGSCSIFALTRPLVFAKTIELKFEKFNAVGMFRPTFFWFCISINLATLCWRQDIIAISTPFARLLISPGQGVVWLTTWGDIAVLAVMQLKDRRQRKEQVSERGLLQVKTTRW